MNRSQRAAIAKADEELRQSIRRLEEMEARRVERDAELDQMMRDLGLESPGEQT